MASVFEWWAYDEAGWSVHRYAAADAEEAYRVAFRRNHDHDPFCFGPACDRGAVDRSPARDHPGRVASCVLGLIGAGGPEPWRLQPEDVPPPPWAGDALRMGRFYR